MMNIDIVQGVLLNLASIGFEMYVMNYFPQIRYIFDSLFF